MNNPNIYRYGQELKKSVRGFRLRKRLLAEFQRSLTPLLEDVPDPSYEDLVDAFGPPEQLAKTLLHEIDVLPLSWKAKAGLAVGVIAVIFAVGFGISSFQNIPEEGELRPDAVPYTGNIDMHHFFAVDDPFTHGDSHWDQPRDMVAYQVELHNTNSVYTNIFVYYSDRHPPTPSRSPLGRLKSLWSMTPAPVLTPSLSTHPTALSPAPSASCCQTPPFHEEPPRRDRRGGIVLFSLYLRPGITPHYLGRCGHRPLGSG